MAYARDGLNYDLPPDQSVSVITNGFWAFETNLAVAASVGGAQGQSSARQQAEIQPLLITAQGSLNAESSTNTNRDETASAQASCHVVVLFDLPVQHAYSISVTNLGVVNPGSLLGQIVVFSEQGEELFASRLPTNSGPSSQSGVLARGTYRLLAEFLLSPLQSPPDSSGNASFSLRMTFAPILPVLNIARSSNNVVLSWTTNGASAFLLQRNTNLVPTNWAFIAGPYPISGSQYSVEQSASEASLFYRLIIP